MHVDAQLGEAFTPGDARVLEGRHEDGDAGGGHVLGEEVLQGEGVDAADGADDEVVGEGDGRVERWFVVRCEVDV